MSDGNIRRDFTYRMTPHSVSTDGLCAKRCAYLYKTNIPPETISQAAHCARCGRSMTAKVIHSEISSDQYQDSKSDE